VLALLHAIVELLGGGERNHHAIPWVNVAPMRTPADPYNPPASLMDSRCESDVESGSPCA
jgi:hypothetical protein